MGQKVPQNALRRVELWGDGRAKWGEKLGRKGMEWSTKKE